MAEQFVLTIGEGDQDTGEYVKQQLIQYNLQYAASSPNTPRVESVYLVVRDQAGCIVGGINATIKINWGVCHVDIFWLDEAYRRSGYGSRLLRQVEEIAKEKGCITVQLETATFQAPDFYKKQGYEIMGSIEILPDGHQQYFLKKSLRPNRD